MAFAQPLEVWGTCSVKDHCRKQPFVTELMLYDRLVIPVPPKDEPEERKRWDKEWDPDRLGRVLDMLGELAIPLEWNAQRRDEFRTRQGAAAALDPYYTTSLQMKLELELGVPKAHVPDGVHRVRPVAAYDSPDVFARDVQVRVPKTREAIDPGRLGAILGRTVLVPEGLPDEDLDALSRALEIARDEEFRQKRGHFHAWLEDLISQGRTETEAILDLQKRIDEYNNILVKRKVRTALKYAFFATKFGMAAAAAGAALSLSAALPPTLTPTLSGILLLAEFATVQAPSEPKLPERTPAAMFYDARKHFGWQ